MMRLTLRTLLAYLDDVLEPAATREIGRKIQESPLAAAQMSRIREVIRRRRLGAPDLEGPGQGIDPNLVAEYLDNTLSPEQVADLERVCLESDVQLAEAAACHQILTLVLGEPQDVAPQSLERFYALGPVHAEGRLQATNGEPAPSQKAGAVVNRPAVVPAASFSETLPDYLKPTPWSQRFGPIVGVALVLLAAVGALMLDRDLARNLFGDKARNQPTETTIVEEPQHPGRPASPDHIAATEPGPEVAATTPLIPPAPTAATLPPGIDPAPPADAPEPLPATVVARPEAPVSAIAPATATEAVTAVGEARPAPMSPKAAAPAEPAPPRVLVPMRYTSQEGVLLRYESGDQHWYVQPRRSEIHALERFACPDPYEATIDLDNGQVQMTLLGETVIEMSPATKEQRLALRIHRGRVLLQRGPVAEKPVTVAVTVDDENWALELSEPDTTVGLEVRIRSPYRAEPPMDGEWYQAAAFVGQGAARFLTAEDDIHTVTAGAMHWLVPPAMDELQAANSVSGTWLDPQQRQTSATLRRYATLFEKEFDPATAVDLLIPALAKDPRPKIAELAVRCLGTTESYPHLVAALARSEHAEARQAAAVGLREWLVQSAERQPVLKRELSTHYPGEEAMPVYRLLIGFTPQEGRDKVVSMQLVDWLRSNYVEVRELAIGQLERLANRRYDYRPLGTATQRELGVQRWLSHIERDGAIVKPE